MRNKDEHKQAQTLLREMGYAVYSAPEGLEPFDLMALGPWDIRFIWVFDRLPTKKDTKRLQRLPRTGYARKEIWVLKSNGQKPDIIEVA